MSTHRLAGSLRPASAEEICDAYGMTGAELAHALGEPVTLPVECDACEGSGRELVYHNPAPWEIGPCNERDVGRCAACLGTGQCEIEIEPRTLDDIEAQAEEQYEFTRSVKR